MQGWPTFRVTYAERPGYAVFGVVVPDTFEIDDECLQTLGFALSALGALERAFGVRSRWMAGGGFIARLRATRARNVLTAFCKREGACAGASAFAEFRRGRGRVAEFVVPAGPATGLWCVPGDD